MAEYSRIAKGSFTAASGQTSAVIPLPFIPDFVEVWNLTNIAAAASAGNILRAYWDNNAPAITPSGKSASQTYVEVYNSTPAVIYDTVFTNGVTGIATPQDGITVFSGGQLLQFGPTKQVVASTKGTTTSFQVTNHGYNVGDTVVFQGLFQSATTGMPQMNDVYLTIVTRTDANNFIVNWNSSGSNYTNLSGSPASALVRKVLYPFLYLPQQNVITAITTGATTTIQTAEYHNFETGQEVAFRIPSAWGTTQLNSLPDTQIPGSPIYGYVQSITDNWTFVVNINSTGFTAFNPNQTVASVNGLTMPQVVAVGDVNTGATAFSGGALYPSPLYPTSTNRVSTINGPAIRGAFVNNTSQGFIIGNGTPQEQAGTGTIVTSSSEIMWRAYLSDYANP